MITIKRFWRIEKAVREVGYEAMIDWSETVVAPVTAQAFASEAIYVICNSGMKNSVAQPIHCYWACNSPWLWALKIP